MRQKPGRKARSTKPEWRNPAVIERLRQCGQRVRWIREQLAIRQDQLAEMSGVSRNCIGGIERGAPTEVAYLMVVADTVGCSFDKLWWQRKKWDKFVAANLEKFTTKRDALAKQMEKETNQK